MIKFLIQFLSKLSGKLNFDILWRICKNLTQGDRMLLALRLIKNDVEQITIRMDNALISTHAWDETLTYPLLRDRHYQGDDIKSVLSWMKHHNRFNSEKNVIVDVGANIGTSSIPFAQKTNCQILAIEPFPENFDLLLKNVYQNNLMDRITCIQKAVYSRSEVVHMIMPKGECGGAKIKQKNYRNASAHEPEIQFETDIPSDGLSNILAAARVSPEQIAFVWSDTEGSETYVVETGKELWRHGIPLFMEIYPPALKLQGDPNNLPSLLSEHFTQFIIGDRLVEQGIKSLLLPIFEFTALLENLTNKNMKMDVLLLPANFQFQVE
jgi:FkbM family methyltransferase